MSLCQHCERRVLLGKTGKVLAHSGPKNHKPECSRSVSGRCPECGLAVFKDGRRCPGTYKVGITEDDG